MRRASYCRWFALALLSIVACAAVVGCDDKPPAASTSSFPGLVRPYTVVGRADVATTTEQRSFGLWQITSTAKTRGEWAQTAKQAALDLHRQHRADYTVVLLTPSERIAEIAYAQVSYAADGKGTLGLDGADLIYYEWDVRVVDRALTDEELAIAELWEAKSPPFRVAILQAVAAMT